MATPALSGRKRLLSAVCNPQVALRDALAFWPYHFLGTR